MLGAAFLHQPPHHFLCGKCYWEAKSQDDRIAPTYDEHRRYCSIWMRLLQPGKSLLGFRIRCDGNAHGGQERAQRIGSRPMLRPPDIAVLQRDAVRFGEPLQDVAHRLPATVIRTA